MNFLQQTCIEFLKMGSIPKHIGVIMDGNRYFIVRCRRFAREKKLSTTEGHIQGYQSFLNLLQWGQKIGIKEISVFAFSIENYNRKQDEVNFLMGLMKSKLDHLQKDLNFIDRNQVQVKVCGDLQLLQDQELKQKFLEIEEHSKNYTQHRLNLCFSYNFTNELENALKQIPSNLSKQEFYKQLNQMLMIQNYPDLILRTSGEHRLSNFLLYQIKNDCVIYFLDKKWPELSFYDFCNAIVQYRQNKS